MIQVSQVSTDSEVLQYAMQWHWNFEKCTYRDVHKLMSNTHRQEDDKHAIEELALEKLSVSNQSCRGNHNTNVSLCGEDGVLPSIRDIVLRQVKEHAPAFERLQSEVDR